MPRYDPLFKEQNLRSYKTSFFYAKITYNEILMIEKTEPEELNEWYRLLAKREFDNGLFKVETTDEQLKVLKQMCLDGDLKGKYLKIVMIYFPNLFQEWCDEMFLAYHYNDGKQYNSGMIKDV